MWVTFTESMVKNQAIIGLVDPKTQQYILDNIDLDKVDLETLVRFIETKEPGVSRAGQSRAKTRSVSRPARPQLNTSPRLLTQKAVPVF